MPDSSSTAKLGPATCTAWPQTVTPPPSSGWSERGTEFLDGMSEAGYLVAAGPLADIDGEGLTILRLPGDGLVARATQLATEDDLSVSGGLLAVTVRP
jgi:uncharacterized protein YciI